MGLVVMGVVGMGVVVTGCPKKNPYDSHTHNHLQKLITVDHDREGGGTGVG